MVDDVGIAWYKQQQWLIMVWRELIMVSYGEYKLNQKTVNVGNPMP